MYKVAIIGAGITGLTIASILADRGISVVVYEKNKNEIGGMCFDEKKEGLNVSKYGPHIFHTNDEEVFSFISRFSNMRSFDHKVKVKTKYGFVDYPVQIDNTIVDHCIESKMERNSLEISYEIFNRIYIQNSYNNNFFNDKYICLPENGYYSLFKNMASSRNILVMYKNIDSYEIKRLLRFYNIVINTGLIGNIIGSENNETFKLNFFRNDELAFSEYESVGVINYNDEGNVTRSTNYSVFNGLYGEAKYIVSERFSSEGIECYPIRTKENIIKYEEQKAICDKLGIITCGRLGSYKYINMGQAIREGIDIANMILKEKLK